MASDLVNYMYMHQAVRTRFIGKWNACLAGLCLGMAGMVLPGVAADTKPSRSELDAKVEALVARMTLDEKIGQMTQPDSQALQNKGDVSKYFLGSVLSGGGSDPAAGNSPKAWLDMVSELKSEALRTRLAIPLIYGIDAVHGHNNIDGAVILPHHIGLGATGNPELVARAEQVTAEECLGTGIEWAFAPCVAVSRDERWGRCYESYGQSPELVSILGAAAVRGLQGDSLSAKPGTILACAKHFVGDGGTQGGKDQGDTVCDEATLRQIHLPPYRAAIQAGVGSIMVSYSSWNGKKMHGSKHLIMDVLKGEMGYEGFVVSDWAAIDQISPDYKADVEQSINAGLDMVMIPYGVKRTNNFVEFIQDLKALVAEGKVPMSRVNDAVSRILRVKYQMGLFENRSVDPRFMASIGSVEHRQVARECVRESLVLLKNDNQALPLPKNLKRLAVVGSAANDLGTQCGGWTIDWQGRQGTVTTGGTTILAAIRQAVSPQTEVVYQPDGQSVTNVEAVVVVLGEKPYAEMQGDRQELNLPARDQALVEHAKVAGVPVITILFSGRPLVLGSAWDRSSAVIAAWWPGTEGAGIADVLFGDFKFMGKLPRAWPVDNQSLAIGGTNQNWLRPVGFGLN
jgi:beta-glucosidase